MTAAAPAVLANDLVGQRFGLLTVISLHSTDPKRGRSWSVECDCGTRETRTTAVLRDSVAKGLSPRCRRHRRIVAIPPPPPSQPRLTARVGLMVLGQGNRHEECRRYSECLMVAAKRDVDAHCPDQCAQRTDVDRFERLIEAIDGRRQSPNCENEVPIWDEDEALRAAPVPYATLRAAVIAALSRCRLTARGIAAVTGIELSTIRGRISDLAHEGLVRKVGAVRETKSPTPSPMWALVQREPVDSDVLYQTTGYEEAAK